MAASLSTILPYEWTGAGGMKLKRVVIVICLRIARGSVVIIRYQIMEN